MFVIEEINKFKKNRGVIRASVTKVINKIETELLKSEANVDNIEELIEHLIEKSNEMKIVDSQIEIHLSADELEEDLTTVEDYLQNI